MKKIIVCVVVLLLTLLISCGEHKTDVTNYLAGEWNEPVDKDSLIYGDSSFGGFHGDGEVYAVYDIIDVKEIIDDYCTPSEGQEIMIKLKLFYCKFEDEMAPPVFKNVPKEYQFDYDSEYYCKYVIDGSGGELFALLDKINSRLYYIVTVS